MPDLQQPSPQNDSHRYRYNDPSCFIFNVCSFQNQKSKRNPIEFKRRIFTVDKTMVSTPEAKQHLMGRCRWICFKTSEDIKIGLACCLLFSEIFNVYPLPFNKEKPLMKNTVPHYWTN